ncbi:PHD finger protein 24 [Amblyraja radiata]|uniref:PHD finger protein 24 n=1 Tax=Amblyraja radiata TaxID=386614 RepID=UPI0014037D28|nr:PHD finger protein 24 [Amblyraja radiata]
MGVLISKRQSVEKVQKASAVVSAFKEGLRDKQPPRGPAQPRAQPAQPPSLGAQEVKATPGPGPSAPGPSAAPQPDSEEAKSTQAAWERLRDGKGVEPEDMEWSQMATPPAYSRPKRQLGDDQSLDIVLEQREEVASAEMCDVCEVWTADDLYPCRICNRVFHDGCLRRMAQFSPAHLQELRETAHTALGWSCHYCDNVNLLLTEEEMFSLKEVFRQCRIIPDSCLTSDDFLHYKHGVHQRQCGGPLPEGQEGEELAQYRALTPSGGGLEWPDFLYHESLLLLDRLRSRNSLLHLLTAKERERARAVFLSPDRSPQGVVSAADCRRAQHTWFLKPAEEAQSCSVSISNVGPMSEKSPASRGRGRAQDRTLLSKDPEDSRPVPWKTFLKENVIYILAARPNSAATHLLPSA